MEEVDRASASRSQFKDAPAVNPCQFPGEDGIVLLEIPADFPGKDGFAHKEIVQEGKAVSQPWLELHRAAAASGKIAEFAFPDDSDTRIQFRHCFFLRSAFGISAG